MTALVWVLVGIGVAVVVVAVVIAVVKKVPLTDAAAILGLGLAAGAILAAGVVVAIGRKNNADNVPGTGHTAGVDTSSAGILGVLDKARDRIRSRLKALLQQGGGG